MREPDATAFVALLPTENGGRQEPTPADVFACVLQVAGRNHDVRLQLDHSLSPGTARRVDLVFLDPSAPSRLSEGATFTLWEGREIGFGRFDRVGGRSAADLDVNTPAA